MEYKYIFASQDHQKSQMTTIDTYHMFKYLIFFKFLIFLSQKSFTIKVNLTNLAHIIKTRQPQQRHSKSGWQSVQNMIIY